MVLARPTQLGDFRLVLAGVPNHLQQLFVPPETTIKTDTVGVPGHYLKFNARDLLGLVPFQSKRQ